MVRLKVRLRRLGKARYGSHALLARFQPCDVGSQYKEVQRSAGVATISTTQLAVPHHRLTPLDPRYIAVRVAQIERQRTGAQWHPSLIQYPAINRALGVDDVTCLAQRFGASRQGTGPDVQYMQRWVGSYRSSHHPAREERCVALRLEKMRIPPCTREMCARRAVIRMELDRDGGHA